MRLTQVIQFVSCMTASLFNLLLILLILSRSSSRLGKYKYFLLVYTINASYFTTTQAVVVPTWYIPTNGYFFFSTIDYLPRWLQQVAVLSCIATYTINGIVLTWSFVYRLAVIESPYPWIVHLPYFPICLSLSILLAAWMVASCIPLMPSPEIEQIFHDELSNMAEIELADVGYIGGQITINGDLNIGMAVCLGSFIAFVCACCAIFIICWFKIGQRLRDIQTTDGSHPNYSFQYKLFILLSLQTCMPIAFNIFPAAICFILSLAKVDAGDLPYVCAMILTFAQICDPIFTIFFIAEYKSFFTRCLHKAIPKVAPTSGSGTGGRSPSPGPTATTGPNV